MIFRDHTGNKRVKIYLETMTRTSKGGLKVKASDPEYPEIEPGYMVFNSREAARILKTLKE